MRKVFWCCAAAAVCLAAAVYLAADYAGRHSDTLLGRCVSAGYQVATKYNPVYRVSQAAALGTYHMAKSLLAPEMAAASAAAEEQCECPGCKGARCGHCPKCCKKAKGDCAKDKPAEDAPMPPMPQVDPVDVPAHNLGKIIIQEEEEPRIQIEKPMPPVEGAEEVPQFMPFVDDQPPVPATMPRVEEASSFKPAGFMKLGDLPKSDVAPAEMPKVEEPPMEESKAQEPQPYHDNPHSNCCPYTGKCPDDEPPPFQPKVTEPGKDEQPKVTQPSKDAKPATSPEPESKPAKKEGKKSKKKVGKIGEGCPGDVRPHFDCIPY
jgi:hypothetical protein